MNRKIDKELLGIKDNLLFVILLSILEVLRQGVTFCLPIFLNGINQGFLNLTNILILFLLVAIILVVNFVTALIIKKTTIKYKCRINRILYDKLYHLKYEILSKNGMVYYVEKINNAVDNYCNYLIRDIPNLIGTICAILASFVLIGILNVFILLGIIAILIIQFFSLKMLNRKLTKKCVSLQNICAKSFSDVLSVLDCVDYVKQSYDYSGINNLISLPIKKIHSSNADVNFLANNVSSIIASFVLNLQFVVYIILGGMLLNDNISGAQFVSAIMFINICFNSFSQLTSIGINKNDYNASVSFIMDELEKNQEENTGTIICNDISSIKIEHEEIGYENNILLHDVNCNFKRGDISFIKGKTGCGKSTLLKYLLRFYDSENIYANNKKIKDYDLTSYRKKVCYVSQNFVIINGKIIDNIFMGNNATNIDEISKLSFLNKFAKKDELFEAQITNNGSNLSGGDKQRIAAARVFVDDYDVLILDEITSQMDDKTGDEVYQEILKKFNDKIIFIVSHNEKNAKFANRVFLLEENKLVEQ